MSEYDRALVIAHHRAESTIKAYEDHLFEKEMERKNRSKPGKRG